MWIAKLRQTRYPNRAAPLLLVAALGIGAAIAPGHKSAAAGNGAAWTSSTGPWSFGVISDTQWTVSDDGHNPNHAAANIIKQIDAPVGAAPSM